MQAKKSVTGYFRYKTFWACLVLAASFCSSDPYLAHRSQPPENTEFAHEHEDLHGSELTQEQRQVSVFILIDLS